MSIPEGFAQVTPYIFAIDAEKYMDHLAAAIGGVETDRSLRPDGKLANGQIRFGEASIMISEAGRGFPASQSTFYLYVENADAAMKQALEDGMEKIMDVADRPYGDRQGGATDRAGNIRGCHSASPVRHINDPAPKALCDGLLVFVSDIAKGSDRHPDVPEYENQQSENNQKLPKGHVRLSGVNMLEPQPSSHQS